MHSTLALLLHNYLLTRAKDEMSPFYVDDIL